MQHVVLNALIAPALILGALPTFALVAVTLAVAYWLATRSEPARPWVETPAAPRWDLPVRMLTATVAVLAIAALAPVLGPHVAGLSSPFPVFGAVLTVFTHRAQGLGGAAGVLAGLLLGLFAPAAFFPTLAVALTVQALTILVGGAGP